MSASQDGSGVIVWMRYGYNADDERWRLFIRFLENDGRQQLIRERRRQRELKDVPEGATVKWVEFNPYLGSNFPDITVDFGDEQVMPDGPTAAFMRYFVGDRLTAMALTSHEIGKTVVVELEEAELDLVLEHAVFCYGQPLYKLAGRTAC